MSQGVVQELPGMPAPSGLRRLESEGRCVVTFAGRVLFCYNADDIGMRNLVVVAVTDAGVGGKETAAVFGLTPEYVSMLRGRARRQGSSGLVKRRGRPPKLTSRQVGRARVWAAEGVTQTEIARRLGVSRPVIHDLVDRLGPAPVQPALAEPADTVGGGDESGVDGGVRERQPEPGEFPSAESESESGAVASAESAAAGGCCGIRCRRQGAGAAGGCPGEQPLCRGNALARVL
jgi:transposase